LGRARAETRTNVAGHGSKECSTMNRWKILAFVLSILMLAAFGVVASLFQANLFVTNSFDQRDPIDESPAGYGLDYQAITLTGDDGYDLAAWYVPSRNRAAVIVQHGYKDDRTSMLPRAEMLARHGYGVMMVDLRAHGESDGESISFGLYEIQDVDAAYQYLLTCPDVDPDRIGALGASMGGVVVLLYASQNPAIKAVVSESAYASLEDQIPAAVEASGLPAFLLAPLVQWFAERELGFEAGDIAPVEHIGSISPRPVFVLHGGVDDVVPSDNGRRLYDAAGEPRFLWLEPDLGHTAFVEERPVEFETRVIAFFDRYLLER
jgi:alpha-beta hydrolase superfamily lysophospholipase